MFSPEDLDSGETYTLQASDGKVSHTDSLVFQGSGYICSKGGRHHISIFELLPSTMNGGWN